MNAAAFTVAPRSVLLSTVRGLEMVEAKVGKVSMGKVKIRKCEGNCEQGRRGRSVLALDSSLVLLCFSL